jgi:phenylacetate-CoA ligase
LAGYCDKSDYYHVYPEYGYTELIDHLGNILPREEGRRGEIVGTSLINNAMPLIRYRTGDIAVMGPPECICGRRYPLWEKVEGRKQEYIITADGRPISLTSLVFGQHWHAFSHIKQLQIEQNQPGSIILRLASTPAFNKEDEEEIREKVAACVKSGLTISFDYVDLIEPTARGKHLFLKQSLPLSSAWAGEVLSMNE